MLGFGPDIQGNYHPDNKIENKRKEETGRGITVFFFTQKVEKSANHSIIAQTKKTENKRKEETGRVG